MVKWLRKQKGKAVDVLALTALFGGSVAAYYVAYRLVKAALEMAGL